MGNLKSLEHYNVRTIVDKKYTYNNFQHITKSFYNNLTTSFLEIKPIFLETNLL